MVLTEYDLERLVVDSTHLLPTYCPLSPKHLHRFPAMPISDIMGKAWQKPVEPAILTRPCRRVGPPRRQKPVDDYGDDYG
jgi:hypothetical protein